MYTFRTQVESQKGGKQLQTTGRVFGHHPFRSSDPVGDWLYGRVLIALITLSRHQPTAQAAKEKVHCVFCMPGAMSRSNSGSMAIFLPSGTGSVHKYLAAPRDHTMLTISFSQVT